MRPAEAVTLTEMLAAKAEQVAWQAWSGAFKTRAARLTRDLELLEAVQGAERKVAWQAWSDAFKARAARRAARTPEEI